MTTKKHEKSTEGIFLELLARKLRENGSTGSQGYPHKGILAEILDTLSEEDRYAAEIAYIDTAGRELIKREVTPGDGDLATKARNVLHMGVGHICSGKSSPEFVGYMAGCIKQFLDGKESSLDSAFRLKNKNHRPKRDPLEDPAVREYNRHIRQYVDLIEGDRAKLPAAEAALLDVLNHLDKYSEEEMDAILGEQVEAIGPRLIDVDSADVAKSNAIDAAYAARYGATPQDHATRNIDPEIINERKKTIKKTLRSLKLY